MTGTATGSEPQAPIEPRRPAPDEDAAHILVIDDDRRIRELLKRYLAEHGYRVTTAENAADARAKLAGLAFDLLVVDVMMPGESGIEFTSPNCCGAVQTCCCSTNPPTTSMWTPCVRWRRPYSTTRGAWW